MTGKGVVRSGCTRERSHRAAPGSGVSAPGAGAGLEEELGDSSAKTHAPNHRPEMGTWHKGQRVWGWGCRGLWSCCLQLKFPLLLFSH